MHISKLHIAAFGPIVDADITASPGLNIIEGANESGKSAVAMFIKFIFYGLSTRTSGDISEKQHYINWGRGYASGYAVCASGDRVYRVERTLNVKTSSDGKPKYSESVKLLDHGTSMPEQLTVSPGEFFFGVPESVFMNSVFSAQGVDVRPDPAAMRESIENILCAADESVNVRRAEDILERTRIRLMHKNRTGGEIIDLIKERDELERLEEESRDSAAALISAEVSLADVKDRIAESAKRAAELDEISDALAMLERRRRADKAEELKTELARSHEELSHTVAEGVDEQFISTLAVAVRDLDRVGHLRAEFDKRSAEVLSRDSAPGTDGAKAYRTAGRRSTISFAMSVVLLIMGLLGIIGSAYLSVSNSPIAPAVIAVSAAAALGGIVSFAVCAAERHRQGTILDRLGLDTEEELDDAALEAEERERELNSLREELDSAERNAVLASDTIFELSRSAGLGDEVAELSAANAAGRLGKYVAEFTARRKSLEAECARLEGQLAETAEGLRDSDIVEESRILESEAGVKASRLTETDVLRLRRERAFRAEQTEGLHRREVELEREVASLRSVAKSPAAIAERLSEVRSQLEAKTAAHDACIKALDTLRAAGEGLRSSIIPRLTESASEILNCVTSGRYSSVGVSPSFNMSFRTEEFGTRELDYLSAGTRDMAYLALRLALVRAMFDGKSVPPVILDESFAYMDEKRVSKALSVLRSSGMQIFLFTCRSLEASLCGDCEVTHLPHPDL